MNSTESRREFLTKAAVVAGGVALKSFAAEGTKPRRIGFVDLNLENYHANVFLQALRGPLKVSGFTVAGATGTKKEESRAWAQKNNVPFFEDDAALNEAVDYFMVLAP